MKILNHILMFCYCFVRQLLGPATCRFSPSCGAYTMHMLSTQPLRVALPAIFRQIRACHPFTNSN